MPRRRQTVTVTNDLDSLLHEIAPQPVLLVRPRFAQKYPSQRTAHIAEMVDLATLNLSHVEGFETV